MTIICVPRHVIVALYIKKATLSKNIKKAALSKKRRLNVLRIYRRNNNKKDCNKITKDMKYIDKKYKIGKTKNIC